MLTKKDYYKITEIFKSVAIQKDDISPDTMFLLFEDRVVEFLKWDNPRFQEGLFRQEIRENI